MAVRPTLSCKRCQQRRVRCDKGRPCSSCVRNKNSHLCIYDKNDILTVEKKNTSFQIFKLNDNSSKLLLQEKVPEIIRKFHGKYLTYASFDKVNFYKAYKQNSEQRLYDGKFGPLSLPFLEEVEPGLKMLLLYFKNQKNNSVKPEPFSDIVDNVSEDKQEMFGKEASIDQLISMLEPLIPSQRFVECSLDFAFSGLYPFIVLLDEEDTRTNASKIINYDHQGTVQLKLSNRNDLAKLCQLVIIFCLNSLYREIQSSSGTVVENELIGPDAIDIINECICKFPNNITLPELQCLMLMRSYRKVAPVVEEPKTNKSLPPVSVGIFIQHAYRLGLHREQTSSDPRHNNLIGKIWYSMLLLDVNETFTFGSPLSTNNIFLSAWILKSQDINESNSNVRDIELEKFAVSDINYVCTELHALLDILRMALDVRGEKPMTAFIKLVSDFETKQLGKPISLFLKPIKPSPASSSVTPMQIEIKTLHAKGILAKKMYLLSLLEHLAVYYDNPRSFDILLFYRKRIQCLTISETIHTFVPLLKNFVHYFDHFGVMVLSPFVREILYRANLLNMEALIRYKFHLFHFNDLYKDFNEEKYLIYELLEKNSILISKCIDYLIGHMQKFKIAGSYPAADTVNLLNIYFYIIQGDDIYKDNSGFEDLKKSKFNCSYLNEMQYIYSTTLDSIPDEESKSSDLMGYDKNDSIWDLFNDKFIDFDSNAYLTAFGGLDTSFMDGDIDIMGDSNIDSLLTIFT